MRAPCAHVSRSHLPGRTRYPIIRRFQAGLQAGPTWVAGEARVMIKIKIKSKIKINTRPSCMGAVSGWREGAAQRAVGYKVACSVRAMISSWSSRDRSQK